MKNYPPQNASSTPTEKHEPKPIRNLILYWAGESKFKTISSQHSPAVIAVQLD